MAENQPDGKPVESFEACLDELEKTVKELEGGDLSLERSLELFERHGSQQRSNSGGPIFPIVRRITDKDLSILRRLAAVAFRSWVSCCRQRWNPRRRKD